MDFRNRDAASPQTARRGALHALWIFFVLQLSGFFSPLLAFFSPSFFLWISCWGLWPRAGHMGLHLQLLGILFCCVCCWKEKECFSSNSRITGEGENYPGLGQMSTLDYEQWPGASHIVYCGSSCDNCV